MSLNPDTGHEKNKSRKVYLTSNQLSYLVSQIPSCYDGNGKGFASTPITARTTSDEQRGTSTKKYDRQHLVSGDSTKCDIFPQRSTNINPFAALLTSGDGSKPDADVAPPGRYSTIHQFPDHQALVLDMEGASESNGSGMPHRLENSLLLAPISSSRQPLSQSIQCLSSANEGFQNKVESRTHPIKASSPYNTSPQASIFAPLQQPPLLLAVPLSSLDLASSEVSSSNQFSTSTLGRQAEAIQSPRGTSPQTSLTCYSSDDLSSPVSPIHTSKIQDNTFSTSTTALLKNNSQNDYEDLTSVSSNPAKSTSLSHVLSLQSSYGSGKVARPTNFILSSSTISPLSPTSHTFHHTTDNLSPISQQSDCSSPTSPYNTFQSSSFRLPLSRSTNAGTSHEIPSITYATGKKSQGVEVDKNQTLGSFSPDDPEHSSSRNQNTFSFVVSLNDQQTQNTSSLASGTLSIPCSSGKGTLSPNTTMSPTSVSNNDIIPSPGHGVTQMQAQFASMSASNGDHDKHTTPQEVLSLGKTKSRKRSKSSINDIQIFKCETCGKEFDQNIGLKNHLRCHRNDKNHVCRFCDEDFHYKTQLRRHERIHARQLHKCRYCEMTLENDYDRVQHERVHRMNKDPQIESNIRRSSKKKKENQMEPEKPNEEEAEKSLPTDD